MGPIKTKNASKLRDAVRSQSAKIMQFKAKTGVAASGKGKERTPWIRLFAAGGNFAHCTEKNGKKMGPSKVRYF